VQIVRMTAAYAADIVTWRYPPPYDCYDMTNVDPGFLASPDSGVFALTDGTGLIGFRSFGPDGQVPGGMYDDSALDTGGGLRPDLTGQGRGREAIQTGLDFGQREFAPAAFRVTVATFNLRAQRVGRGAGLPQYRELPRLHRRPELRDADQAREHAVAPSRTRPSLDRP
jgi:RimJ/RimL family protein N-acetyltransferase